MSHSDANFACQQDTLLDFEIIGLRTFDQSSARKIKSMLQEVIVNVDPRPILKIQCLSKSAPFQIINCTTNDFNRTNDDLEIISLKPNDVEQEYTVEDVPPRALQAAFLIPESAFMIGQQQQQQPKLLIS